MLLNLNFSLMPTLTSPATKRTSVDLQKFYFLTRRNFIVDLLSNSLSGAWGCLFSDHSTTFSVKQKGESIILAFDADAALQCLWPCAVMKRIRFHAFRSLQTLNLLQYIISLNWLCVDWNIPKQFPRTWTYAKVSHHCQTLVRTFSSPSALIKTLSGIM